MESCFQTWIYHKLSHIDFIGIVFSQSHWLLHDSHCVQGGKLIESRGPGLDPNSGHHVVSLSKTPKFWLIPTNQWLDPDITEKLLKRILVLKTNHQTIYFQAYAPELYLLEATPEVRAVFAASSEGSTRPQTRTSYDYNPYSGQSKKPLLVRLSYYVNRCRLIIILNMYEDVFDWFRIRSCSFV